MTLQELKSLIDSNFPDNTTGLITPAKERLVLKAIADFIISNQGQVDQAPFVYDPLFSYPIDQPVIYQNQWYLSLEAANLGNTPSANPLKWDPVSGFSDAIKFWEAGVYLANLSMVVNNNSLYILDRAVVGSDPFVSTNFTTELNAGKWIILGGSSGGSMTGAQIRDALELLPDPDRLAATAILGFTADIINALTAANAPSTSNPYATLADIPDLVVGNRIVNPGTLTINTPTSATLTGAEWIWEGVVKTYTGALVLTTSPTDPNNRFDIVTFSAANTPAVEDGTPAADPVVPSPAVAGHLTAHIIYRPFSGEDIVIPETRDPATKSKSGGIGEYAPIWQMTVGKNTYYDFKIGYVGWASDYSSSGQRPQNGIVAVNFVTKVALTEIDPTRVIIQTMGGGDQNGDFVLVQTTASEVTLFTKKTAFFQTLIFQFVGGYSGTVSKDSLIDQGVYAALPAGVNYSSWNGRGFVISTGTTLNFDRPRSYGMATALTGNLTVATAYADDSVMVKVIHNDTTEPTITVPVGVTKKLLSGSYTISVDNLYLLIIDKNAAGDVVRVNYTISQNTL